MFGFGKVGKHIVLTRKDNEQTAQKKLSAALVVGFIVGVCVNLGNLDIGEELFNYGVPYDIARFLSSGIFPTTFMQVNLCFMFIALAVSVLPLLTGRT